MNLYIFNYIIKDETISALVRFGKTRSESDYFEVARGIIEFSADRLTDGDIIKEYVLRKMLEGASLPDITRLRNYLRHDIKTIYNEIIAPDWKTVFEECGYLSLFDIDMPKRTSEIPGYTESFELMLGCNSNEALGGAVLAHYESFNNKPI